MPKMTPIMTYAKPLKRPGFDGYCIGPYHILDVLSTGALNHRYLVKHVLTGMIYTLKTIDMCYLKKDVSLDRNVVFQMEKMRSLCHPNLICVHEVLASTTHVFIVSEVALGVRFLDSVLTYRSINEEELSRTIFRQLVNVVSFCHSFGIYHREICDDSVILTACGEFKISDFGNSIMKDGNNYRLPSGSWSLHFTAPEVWTSSHNSYDGSKADAFSLGAVLYVLLTGTRPFDDPRELEVLRKVHTCSVAYPAYLSHQAVDLLEKLLDRNPEERWNVEMVKGHPWFVDEQLPVQPLIEYSFPSFTLDGQYVTSPMTPFSNDHNDPWNVRNPRGPSNQHAIWNSPWDAALNMTKMKNPSWSYWK